MEELFSEHISKYWISSERGLRLFQMPGGKFPLWGWVMRRKLNAIKRIENPLSSTIEWGDEREKAREWKCEDSICTSICKLLVLSEKKIMYAGRRIHKTSAGLCGDNKQQNKTFQPLCSPGIYKFSLDSGKTTTKHVYQQFCSIQYLRYVRKTKLWSGLQTMICPVTYGFASAMIRFKEVRLKTAIKLIIFEYRKTLVSIPVLP